MATADRNLLFGILALQNNLITRDGLLSAFNTWIADKSQNLGDLLQSRGELTLNQLSLLNALTEELIRQLGTPEKCLQHLSSIPSAHADLAKFSDPDLQASLQHVSQPDPGRNAQEWSTIALTTVGSESNVGCRFRILRPHARGGLGLVSVAHDAELNREVALKEIQGQFADDAESRARFLLEAEITGGLEHPGIVPVYGLGQYNDGRPFYAMRFIRGDSLKEALEDFHAASSALSETERNLRLRRLLQRFIDVCEALHYAHSRGVLHRDLKPGNIMLGKYGETLVVDWGLARPATRTKDNASEPSQSVEEEPLLRPQQDSSKTQMGAAIGTPHYMSPEQASGRLDLLGPATDVYSLGATLYVILAGQPPVEGSDTAEILRNVQLGRIIPLRKLNPRLPRSLAAICQQALALEPAERYESARALADDLEHWLADEPVSAYREPLVVSAARWVRRNQSIVSSVAAGLLACLVAAFILAGMATAHNRSMQTANETLRNTNKLLDAERRNAQTLAEEKTRLATAAVKTAEEAESQRKRAESAEFETRLHYYATSMPLASENWRSHHNPDQLARQLKEFEPTAEQFDVRGFEWHYLNHHINDQQVTLGGSEWRCTSAVFLDNRTVVLAGPNHITLFDLETNQLEPLTVPAKGVYFLAQTSVGPFAIGIQGHRFLVWQLRDRQLQLRREIAQDGAVLQNMMKVSADGNFLIYGYFSAPYSKGGIRIVDLRTGQVEECYHHGRIPRSYAISPDGRYLAYHATVSFDVRDVEVIDRQTGEVCATLAPANSHVHHLEFSPDGRQLVVDIHTVHVRIANTVDWTWQRTLEPTLSNNLHCGCGFLTAYTADSRWLALCSQALLSESSLKIVQIWDSSTGRILKTFGGMRAATWSAAFSPDNRHLAVTGEDGRTLIWQVDADSQFVDADLSSPVPKRGISAMAFDRDGGVLAAGSQEGNVRLWDTIEKREVAMFSSQASAITALAITDDRSRVISGDGSGVVCVRSSSDGAIVHRWTVAPGKVLSLLVASDNKSLWVGASSGLILVYDLESGKRRATLAMHVGPVNVLTEVGDGTIASAGDDGSVQFWDATTGEHLRVLQFQDPISHLRFAVDGSSSAYGSKEKLRAVQFKPDDGTVLSHWEPIDYFTTHAILFSKDLGWAAMYRAHAEGGRAGRHDWKKSTDIYDSDRPGSCGAMDPTDRLMAFGHADGTVGILDLSDGTRRIWMAHTGGYAALAVARNSETLAAGRRDGPIEILTGETGTVERSLVGHQESVTALVFNPEESLLASGSLDGHVRLWNIADGILRGELPKFPTAIRSLAFSPDGTKLAVGGGQSDWRSQTSLWSVASLQLVRELEPFAKRLSVGATRDLEFLSNDSLLVAQGDFWTNLEGKLKKWRQLAAAEPWQLGNHSRPVVALASSPVDNTMAVAHVSDEVQLWSTDAASKIVGRIKTDGLGISDLAYSPGGETLAIAVYGSTTNDKPELSRIQPQVRLWDVRQQRMRGTIPVRSNVASLAWSLSGETIWALTHDGELLRLPGPTAPQRTFEPPVPEVIFDVAPAPIGAMVIEPEPLRIIPGAPVSRTALVRRPEKIAGLLSWSLETSNHSHGFQTLITDGDERVITAGRQDSSIRVWNKEAQLEQVFLGHNTIVQCLKVHPEGRYLASVAEDGTARIWDLQTGRCVRTLEFGRAVTSVDWSVGGERLLIGGSDFISIRDARSGAVLQANFGAGTSKAVAWSPNQNEFTTIDRSGKLHWWRVRDVSKLASVQADTKNDVRAMQWSPDGQRIATGGVDGVIRIWNGATRELECELRSEETVLNALAWSADSQRLAACGTRHAVWDVNARQLIYDVVSVGPSFGCGWLVNDERLVCAVDRGFRVVDPLTKTTMAESLAAGKQLLVRSALSPDGKTLLVRRQAKLTAWDLESSRPRASWANLRGDGDAYSPDGKWLATFVRATAKENLWLASAEAPQERRTLAPHPAGISALAWSPASDLIATGDLQGNVRLCTLAGEVKSVVAHTGPITGLVWQNAESPLAIIVGEKSVHLWDPASGEESLLLNSDVPVRTLARISDDSWVCALVQRAIRCKAGKLDSTSLCEVNAGIRNMQWRNGQLVVASEGNEVAVWRPDARTSQSLGRLGTPAWWLPGQNDIVLADAANFLPVRAFDVKQNKPLGSLLVALEDDQFACVGASGHYFGSEQVHDHLVYVVVHEDGRQEVVGVREFSKRFDWVNKPAFATLLSE